MARVAWVSAHLGALRAAHDALFAASGGGSGGGGGGGGGGHTDASAAAVPFHFFADHMASLALDCGATTTTTTATTTTTTSSSSSSSTGTAADGDGCGARLPAHERQGHRRPDQVGARSYSFGIIPNRDGFFESVAPAVSE